jgi:D-aspartate ligase
MQKPDTSTPVLVLGANNYCALGIVRSLGRWGVRTYCLTAERNPIAARSRFCAGTIPGGFNEADPDATLNALHAAARRIGGRPILIATFDPRTLFVDAHRASLSESFILPQPRAGAVEALFDKRSLQRLCEMHGIPAPRSRFPHTVEELERDAGGLQYPLVLKGINPDLLMGRTGGERMGIARDWRELQALWRRFHDPEHRNLLLQEFVPGEVENNWIVSASFGADGICHFALGGQKLRQLPVSGGVTSLAVTAPAEVPLQGLQELVHVTGFHGVLDADLRLDDRDGSYKLLDVNPRPGANFRAFVDCNGLDAVRAHYLDLTGQQVPVAEPVWGRRWLAEDKDLWAMREMLRDGSISLGSWIRSVVSIDEFAYLDAGDIAPSWHFARETATGLLRGRLNRKRA